MQRPRPGAFALGVVSAHALRVAGAVLVVLAGAITWLSLSTDYGFAVDTSASGASQTTTNAALSVDALVAFAGAHPAYPIAIVVGMALFALGDDVPLLGD
jgi:hypothetical protein